MGEAFLEGKLGVPDKALLPKTNVRLPYVLVADEAFPLRENLMKPNPRDALELPERVYNYRLSRARRTIENAFGIAASRFRVFKRQINARVHFVIGITKAVIDLLKQRKFKVLSSRLR